MESIKIENSEMLSDTNSGNMGVIHDSFVHQLNDCLAKKSNGAIKQALILEVDAPIFRVLASGTVVISRVGFCYEENLD